MEEEKKIFSFNQMYETAITNKQKYFGVPETLGIKLKEKRDFGFKKYGEDSFQGSLENCMTSPTLDHAQEELIDCLNYLLHEQYKNDLLQENNDTLRHLTQTTISLYMDIEKLKHI